MTQITVREVDRKVEEITPTVKEMYKMLVVSNGELSIVERLRNIETYMKNEEKVREDAKNERRTYIRMIFGIVAANVFVWFSTFLYWVIKIVPVVK